MLFYLIAPKYLIHDNIFATPEVQKEQEILFTSQKLIPLISAVYLQEDKKIT